jgi:dipeptidyl aminopeptidase/acylaminoacyl peptidase
VVSRVGDSPIADYLLAYADETEDLKAFDRSLFGGSPDQVGEKYHDASPLTYLPQIRVPLWIAAGRADPRCPMRQILSYVDALTRHQITYELYQYDAGHARWRTGNASARCARSSGSSCAISA